MKVGIAGAGLLGRLLSLELSAKGWQVNLFDQDDRTGQASCGYVAAGMLAPLSEMVIAEKVLYDLGIESLQRWPDILAQLAKPVYFQQAGTLLTAHPRDQAELMYHAKKLMSNIPQPNLIRQLDKTQAQALEPELQFNQTVFHLTVEGQIDNTDLYPALASEIIHRGVQWHSAKVVNQVRAGRIVCHDGSYDFDCVFDCRGLGAKVDYPDLRGVRGELLWLYAPEVNLKHPIRLIHPRYPIYVVPRPNHIYVVGASEIESEDFSPISLRSTMELLSAAYALHSGFAEARIVKTLVNCRPTFRDHLPRIYHEEGLIAINGLYRHGYLLAPALIHAVLNLLDGGDVGKYQAIVQPKFGS